MAYAYLEFPKWNHFKRGGKIVQNAEEEKAIGRGWYNTPNEIPKPWFIWDKIAALKPWFERWDWLLKPLAWFVGFLFTAAGPWLTWGLAHLSSDLDLLGIANE